MSRDENKEFFRKRPPIFWWILAIILAAAFAVVSWTTCLHIFNFPEKAENYLLLRKLKRLVPIRNFPPSETPDGDPASPKVAFKKFFPIEDRALEALNTRLKRNYLTNYKESKFVTYVEGDYRITHLRPLASTDFFHPGVAVRAQAFVPPDEANELDEAVNYPVVLELLLPTDGEIGEPLFKAGDLLALSTIKHRTAVLHVTKLGGREDPLICLTVVPLSYENYRSAGGASLPLSPPDPLNLSAPFPVMGENRR